MGTTTKKILQSVTNTDTDHTTGEIKKEQTTETIYVPSEPPFVKMYIDDVGTLAKIHKGANALLHELAMRVDYDGYVSLNKIVRKKICEKLDILNQVLSNYLQILKKKNLVIEECRGVYFLNPTFFAKGQWCDVYKNRGKYSSMTMEIKYKEDGTKEVKTKLTKTKGQEEQAELKLV